MAIRLWSDFQYVDSTKTILGIWTLVNHDVGKENFAVSKKY